MKILFDHNTPIPLRNYLLDHTVHAAVEMGWDRLGNGALLDAAEQEGYEVIVTADQSMRHQQNLTCRKIGVVVLLTTDWNKIRLRTEAVRAAIEEAQQGDFKEVPI